MKQDLVNGSFVAIVGNIYQQGVAATLPWLVAMTCVIVVDLLTGLRKAWLCGEEIRWSRGIRCTMSKTVAYYAFSVAAVMVEIASGCEYDIAKWSCLLVCGIEGMSIVGNILRPHGIVISLKGVMRVIGGKFGVDHLDETITMKKGVKK